MREGLSSWLAESRFSLGLSLGCFCAQVGGGREGGREREREGKREGGREREGGEGLGSNTSWYGFNFWNHTHVLYTQKVK